jgi:secreted PhoX family phosphatase
MDKLKNMANRQIGRRDLLKALAASGGAIAVTSIVPGKWAKPVIEAGLLPAHAQGSPTPMLEITLTWYDSVDLDLRVTEPDGTEVSPNNRNGSTLLHSGDDFPDVGGTGQERIDDKGSLADGTYRVYVDWVATGALRAAAVPDPRPVLVIKTHQETVTINISISEDGIVEAATVSFSSGSITVLV